MQKSERQIQLFNNGQERTKSALKPLLIARKPDLKPNDLFKTPKWVYSPFQTIDLDPCAAFDSSIGKVNWAIERAENGLEEEWFGFVFCNPPYSQKEKWIEKMIDHGNGILLLPERGSAPWFGPLAMACGSYWVMGKKINFIGGPSSNPLGSVLFLFGIEAVKRALSSDLPGHLVTVESFNERECN